MIDAAPASPDVAVASAVAKAALYLRVSTGRQAESDLSIPDQRRQITAYCVAKGWDVAAEFVEPGNTATDDRRPAFPKLITHVFGIDREEVARPKRFELLTPRFVV